MDFKDKVAVITGGASGIGYATAMSMAGSGADIVIVDVNQQRLKEVQKELKALGRRVMVVQCDVSKNKEVSAMAEQVLEAMGRVDILMNNAGVMLRGFADTLEEADWEWILGINLYGVIYCCQAFLPHLMARGSGYIINTSSIGGLISGRPNSIGYSTSKFAVTGFTEVLYKYLKPKGIGVSLLCPGLVRTNLPENFRYAGNNLEGLGHIKEIPKAPGIMEPEEVAAMVVDAVQQNRYLILTQPKLFQGLMEKRVQDMQGFLDGQLSQEKRNPNAGF
jgi:NAD(P)-dependent dehydrogenase (short-subunit alcohol dehydrogenase family)